MSKKLENAKALVDNSKQYELEEALELLPKVSISKFEGSAEVVINFKLNDKQRQESIRGSVTFPHSFGEEKKILVLAEESRWDEAQKAGADYAGLDEYIKKIEEGWLDFDVVIATPQVMPQIARLGKYLGRRGLMPNPKNQTVTEDLEKVIKMYKSGKKDYKMNDQDAVKVTFGTVNMPTEELKANFEELKKALTPYVQRFGLQAVRNVYVSPTMGPSMKLNPSVLG